MSEVPSDVKKKLIHLGGTEESVMGPPETSVGAASELEALNIALCNENRELRIMCAIAHAGLSLYTDDGELQDNRELPAIDWKRDTVGDIERKLHERHAKRLRAENDKRKRVFIASGVPRK